jgi:hypothetical protein
MSLDKAKGSRILCLWCMDLSVEVYDMETLTCNGTLTSTNGIHMD